MRALLSMFQLEHGWGQLLTAKDHSPEISLQRYGLILSRVQFVSRLFGMLSILWIAIDAVFWPWPALGAISAVRGAAALSFGILAVYRFENGAAGLHRALVAFFLIPSGLILGVEFALAYTGLHHHQAFATQAYLYCPLLLAACLSLFPLTVCESSLAAAPLIPVALLPTILWPDLYATAEPMAILFLLVLIAGISCIAALSQLNFLISLVEKSVTDGLTGAVTRKFGERMLEALFAMSQRKNSALSVLFLDLDRFKSVNDRFGHSKGDDVLRCAATSIRSVARRQDILVRWGGEEFVLIMPDTDGRDVQGFIDRLAGFGIGLAPDAAPITVSMGAAERRSDQTDTIAALIAAADRRMYAAKEAGRNCYFGPNGMVVHGIFGSDRSRSGHTADSVRTGRNEARDFSLA